VESIPLNEGPAPLPFGCDAREHDRLLTSAVIGPTQTSDSGSTTETEKPNISHLVCVCTEALTRCAIKKQSYTHPLW